MAKFFISRCSICHSLPHPKRHTYMQWEYVVASMKRVDEDDKKMVLQYLKKNAR